MKILILAFTNLSRDPRVFRQIQGLKDQFQVTAAGPLPPAQTDVDFISLPYKSASRFEKLFSLISTLLGFPLVGYWFQNRHQQLFKILSKEKFDLIIANDLETLPLAIKIKASFGTRVLFDAHEWYADQTRGSFRHKMKARWADLACRHLLKKVDGMMTVSEGLADLYQQHYGVTAEVVYNFPYLGKLSFSKEPRKEIRMIHHGGANSNRGILEIIDLVNGLDERFTLDLVLVKGDSHYFEQIQSAISRSSKVRLLPPWPLEKIVDELKNYDLGIFFINANTLNLKHTMPNKLFEFICASLGVVIGPGGEAASLIQKYQCGYVIEDTNLQKVKSDLNNLKTETFDVWKDNSKKAAEFLNANVSELKIRKMILNIENKKESTKC